MNRNQRYDVYTLASPLRSSFSALTPLVGSFNPQKRVPDMTYNVLDGTLNFAQSNPTEKEGGGQHADAIVQDMIRYENALGLRNAVHYLPCAKKMHHRKLV